MLASHDPRVQLVYFGFLLLPLICIPFVYVGMRNTCIITSPEGIINHSSGYRIYSPWNNIAGRTLAISSSNSGMALRLKQPATEMSISQGIEQDRPALEIGRWMRWVGGNGYNTPRVIPVGRFLAANHGLEEDIKQYAPQVFPEEAVTSKQGLDNSESIM